jgi:hypothetical protein
MSDLQHDIYRMTEAQEKALWQDCVFVFDTSALLALYLYPEEARQQIYQEIFERIRGRLWLPHHVFFEYLKNKGAKIREPISRSYQPLNETYIQPLLDAVAKSLNKIEALKNNIRPANRHPHMVSEDLELYARQLKDFAETTAGFGKTFNDQMEQKIREILLLEQHDTVSEKVQQYFRVGREFSYDEILKISAEGKHRYEFRIPPGYEDLKDKVGTQIFGDLIIWKQILEYSRSEKKHIVFICNDLKEDWWQLVSTGKGEKKHAGPRQELLKEIHDHSGVRFWMYTPARFLDVANTLIKANVLSRYIEQMLRLTVPASLEKSLVYICDHCSHQLSVDTGTLRLNFEVAAAEPGTTARVENRYLARDTFPCGNCRQAISVTFEVWEYPAGIISHQQTQLKGAALIRENPIDESRLLHEYEDVRAGLEEVFIIERRVLHLKAGKPRKILFKAPVDGGDTLFQLECLAPDGPDSGKRLLAEAFTGRQEKISRTLVLGHGTTRFVFRHEGDLPGQEIRALVFTPATDMSLALRVSSYPGSGHYLDKLYY